MPQANNPKPLPEQEQAGAKAWEDFGLWLRDGPVLIQRLPASPFQRRMLVEALQFIVNVTEFLEGE